MKLKNAKSEPKKDPLDQKLWLPVNPFWGARKPAVYSDAPIAAYRGNPLIEALGPIYSRSQLEPLLWERPVVAPGEASLPVHIRKHALQAALKLFVPLPGAYQLEEHISLAIRGGYQHRNPVFAKYWPQALSKVEGFSVERPASPLFFATWHNACLIGVSGMGKSLTLHQILGREYPQVLDHSRYKGHNCNHSQLVWLKLNCPPDGSTKGLCLMFLHSVDFVLGTNYAEQYLRGRPKTVDDLLPKIARIATLHSLGFLIMDELQHLCPQYCGGDKRAMNFFVNFSDQIGVPILLVGTFAAEPLFTGEFRQVRRIDGHGPFIWLPMVNNKAWHDFTQALWRYQYLEQECRWTEDFANVLLDASQGIIDYAVKIYFLAQVRGMMRGIKSLNKHLIRSVAHDSLQLSKRVLDALRHKDWDDLERPEDLPPLDWNILYERETKPEFVSLSSVKASDAPGAQTEDKTQKQTSEKSKRNGSQETNGNNGRKVTSIMGIIAAAKDTNKDTTSRSALKQAGIIRELTELVEQLPGAASVERTHPSRNGNHHGNDN